MSDDPLADEASLAHWLQRRGAMISTEVRGRENVPPRVIFSASVRVDVLLAGLHELLPRLQAAEQACLMFGWTGARMDTDRDKAAHQLWRRWAELAGSDFLSPERHPELSDEVIAKLAAERDAIRAATLAKLRGES